MTNLITEARELCAAATPGPWGFSDTTDVCGCKGEFRAPSPHSGLMLVRAWCNDADTAFIARSRTLIPQLCDALEKAEGNLDAVWDMYQSAERELKKVQEQNKKLVHELSKLACESVKRDVALAKLEAEVMAACNSVRWVPVTEQLPTERGYYLAVIKRIAPDELGGNLTNVKKMRWLGEDWRYPFHIPEWINEAITETVTHWMPLPNPPKEEIE